MMVHVSSVGIIKVRYSSTLKFLVQFFAGVTWWLWRRDHAGCNVWVFCPSFEGCGAGSSAFPPFGCQLKYLANLSNDPTEYPAALARGPPTSFNSGIVLQASYSNARSQWLEGCRDLKRL